MIEKIQKYSFAFPLLSALIVALAFLASGCMIKHGLVAFRHADNFVTVKGLAQKDVEADLVIWPLKHSSTGNDLAQVQAEVEANTQRVIVFLGTQGIGDKEIVSRKLEVTDLLAQQYRPEGADMARFIISETVIVRSNNLDAVDKAAQNIGDLLKQGVSISRDSQGGTAGNPEYIYTKLNDIKPQMIADATKSARESAQQFAKDSGAHVGKIREAYQGMFEILPRDSNASYTERQERYKTVRVVSTLKFYLE